MQPVEDDEKSFWLGGEEIRCDVISHYQMLAAESGIDFQVIFDSDSKLVSEEELGWEEVSKQTTVDRKQNFHCEQLNSHCDTERSEAEAISSNMERDCFVAGAPRNDVGNAGGTR